MAREESDMNNDVREITMNDQSDDELYFSVICDPGHDRTVRELTALSRESRELVWADMIGADPPIHSNRTRSSPTPSTRDETSSTALEESLARMEQEIQSLPAGQGRELILNTALGQSRHCRASFLRASGDDPTKGAHGLSRHMECKASLFGRDKVEVPIGLEDLSDDDMATLKCGAMQFLPRMDRGGRLVFISRYQELVFQEPENIVRPHLFLRLC